MTGTTLSNEVRFIKLGLLILFAAISLVCTGYILYNFIKIPSFRRRFQNQTLFILVFTVSLNTIFNIITVFRFYARGYVTPQNPTYCLSWQIIDYIFTASIVWSKALFILQRYILVFHPYRLRTIKQRLIFHYIPLVLINLYLILFFISVNLYGSGRYTQKYQPNYHQKFCGVQYLDRENGLGTFNWLFNILFPAFIVIFGSIFLVIRVLWKRRDMQRHLRNWSKNWKMIIQLLAIAVNYAIVWLPLAIISLAAMSSDDTESRTYTISNEFDYIAYLSEMTLPMVALFFWPEIMRKLHRRIRPNTIASVTLGQYSTHS